MTDEDATPAGWQEVGDTAFERERYTPQPVDLFAHTASDVGVQLMPVDPNVSQENDGEYRVGVLPDVESSSSDVRPLTGASDHAAALKVAREFMSAYNDRCVDGDERLESLIDEFADADGD